MRQRGLTLVELLVALVLLAVALTGLMALWTFGFNTTRRSQDLAVGYNVARHEIERAKNISFLFLPETTWTRGYDGLGNPTTEGNPHLTAITTIETIPDANGEINNRCLRVLRIRVVERDTDGPVFQTSTYLTRGGI